ncbi:uncharacterized protein LOC134289722 [Aedes albopictus]|uniref:Pro-Pol polyprotein n=1 Tax=Aedes albopictus TaxID=7160 RepID=A0ABM1ZRU2_AEDAL
MSEDAATHNCGACRNPDSADAGMVACDDCCVWFHYSCAGVSPEVAKRPWKCKTCLAPLGTTPLNTGASKKNPKTASAGKRGEDGKSVRSNVGAKAGKNGARNAPPPNGADFNPKDPAKDVGIAKSVRTTSSNARLQAQLTLQRLEEEALLEKRKMDEERRQLEEERALMEKERAIRSREIAAQEKYIQAKFELETRLAEEDGSARLSVAAGPAKVHDWLKANQMQLGAGLKVPEDEKEPKPVESLKVPLQNYDLRSESSPKLSVINDFVPEQRNLVGRAERGEEPEDDGQCFRQESPSFAGSVARSVPREVGPTAEQLSARQIWPKKLPSFSGDPEDWPLFYSSYETGNTACGFSNIENLIRLRECLRGPAREAVLTKLMFPHSVPSIIETLRRLYGRPELLVKNLLQKVRRLETPKPERLDTLMAFGMAVNQLCDHLEAANLQGHLFNPTLLEELVEKLPATVKLEWVRFKRMYRHPSLKEFGEFMETLVADASEVTTLVQPKPGASKLDKLPRREKGQVFTHVSSSVESNTERQPCPICGGTDHRVRNCEKFKQMDVESRIKAVERWKLCGVCLHDHGKWRCRTKIRCDVSGCQGRHHPLLHRSVTPVQGVTQVHERLNKSVLFRIIPLTLHHGSRSYDTYAFLDEGSNMTLVEADLIRELGIEGVPEPLELKWTSDIGRTEYSSRRADIIVTGKGPTNCYRLNSAHTVDCLNLPRQSLSIEDLHERYPYLRDVPVTSYEMAVPRVLIGLDNIELFSPLESRTGGSDGPIAVRCLLGWTIYGPVAIGSVTPGVVSVHRCGCNEDIDLNEMVRKQYVLEDAGISPFPLPEPTEEKRAREILERTTVKVNGQYETGLLWKTDDITLPDSRPMAFSRLRSLEAKLMKDPELRSNVHNQINEYLRKGYAHKATEEELAAMNEQQVWFLPLNVVTHPRKPDKKRLVWDAAARVNGVSLNSQLLKGPDQLVTLPSVICKFRERSIGFGGDVREMFHQLKMRQSDKRFQLFLFRFDTSKPPDVYMMDVATFGATCSPCSALYVMRLNADSCKEEFPAACDAIKEKTYMDDYYDSLNTPDEAGMRALQVREVHARAGFEMRNWVSNSPKVLEILGETVEMKSLPITADKQTAERVLGMTWEPTEDVFLFSVDLHEHLMDYVLRNRRPTKRTALRCIMSFFDPLGLLSPYLIHGKVIMQDLWRAGIDWDTEVGESEFAKWTEWTKILPKLNSIKVPRCYFEQVRPEDLSQLQLHVFTDASEQAYGCAAYLRSVSEGKVRCILVMGKSKVAPLKALSIPRMELQAAVLGSRLLDSICSNHTLKITDRYLWTDSSTVLSWIRADHRKFKPYVAHRVGEILSLTQPDQWHWVASRNNVADCLTKWCKDTEPTSDSRWFNGPNFLYDSEDSWLTKDIGPSRADEELRPCFVLHHTITSSCIIDVSRFSRWETILRTVALVKRFISNCQRRLRGLPLEAVNVTENVLKSVIRTTPALRVPLRQKEYVDAENLLFRIAQTDSYPDEMEILLNNRDKPSDKWLNLEKSSALFKLSPFVDEFGVLRVEGRTAHAMYAAFDARFPVIMPKNHPLTVLLLNHYHRRYGHANRETVVNQVRQRFEISHLRTTIDKAVKGCQWCKINKCKPQPPRMAPLPEQRLTPYIRPFSYVGLDYLGPLEVVVGRRREKRYVAVFTCLVVRAVHLEVAHDLSTPSCIMAIRRFVRRRGSPVEIFSDNGTNFVGASRILADQIKSVNVDCADTFTDANTKWTFNPPGAPHMGGAWERMVRSVKEAMRALDDGRKLDDEILLTVLAEVESFINSRPLTYMPQESGGTEALTPNHFIFGNSSGVHNPLRTPVDLAEALRNSYKRSQYLSDAVWDRWLKEYFPAVNKRSKWFCDTKPVKVGDLVYVTEGKRRTWVRGKVEELITNKDGRVRQVIVKTASGTLKRPVVKLAVMEILSNGESRANQPEAAPDSRGGDCYGNTEPPQPFAVPGAHTLVRRE